ncbi:FAD-dependent oxidoreductase, partial [Pseudomonas aeruginosa]|uniref:FAD-dependent oxidoreductase n=1 Tax=Pseudomonas aeruginosa TaxID=287 RepID=UPI00265EE031
ADKKHVTILGDGLIGCEFANDLAAHGIKVTVIGYPYGKLVIATGATPIVIPIEGDSSATLSVNDLADYRRFRQQLADKKHVTILGDGLIGCEFANDLAAHGIKVTVIG